MSTHFYIFLFADTQKLGEGKPNNSLDLSAELLPQLSEFNSAVDINQFLARLLVLVTKGPRLPALRLRPGLHH